MHEAVSDILAERVAGADGVSRMVLLSLGVHAAVLAAIVLMPASWRSRASAGRSHADDDFAQGGRRRTPADHADRRARRAGESPRRRASEAGGAAGAKGAGDGGAGADSEAAAEDAAAKPIDKPADKSSSTEADERTGGQDGRCAGRHRRRADSVRGADAAVRRRHELGCARPTTPISAAPPTWRR